MRLRSFSLAAGLVFFAATAQAQVLLNDSFDAENGGATQLNYNAFSNWQVQGGTTVDLIGPGNGFGLSCVSGSCVDMSGSSGTTSNGDLRSKLSYSFAAGDVMSFQVAASGNQRGGEPDWFGLYFSFASETSIEDLIVDSGLGANNTGDWSDIFGLSIYRQLRPTDPYYTWSLQFTATSSGSVAFGMRTLTTDQVGPMVDNARIERRPFQEVPEPVSATLLLASGLALGASRMRRRIR